MGGRGGSGAPCGGSLNEPQPEAAEQPGGPAGVHRYEDQRQARPGTQPPSLEREAGAVRHECRACRAARAGRKRRRHRRQDERRRHQLARAHGARRVGQHLGLPPAVPKILSGDRAELLPRPVDRADRRVEDDAIAPPAQAVVQVEVLVGEEPLVPAPDRPKDLRPEAAERNRLDLATTFAGAGPAPDPGVADAEPRRERRTDCAPPRAGGTHLAPAAHVRRALLLERAQARRDVTGGHLRVRVEAKDDFPARGCEPDVERSRDRPRRVVEHPRARRSRERGRRVVGASVDDEQLEPARDGLPENRTHARLDVRSLVSGRYDDGDEGRHGTPGGGGSG